MNRALICTLALLAGCAGPLPTAAPARAQTALPGVIRPIGLSVGRTDTIAVADLVGADLAESGGLTFDAAGAGVRADYDAARSSLALSPAGDSTGLRLLGLAIGDARYAIPLVVSRPVTHTFTFTPDLAPAGAEMPEVFVIGAFNDWARGRDRLADADGDGLLAVTLPIEPGRYEYKFTVDGREVTDTANADSVLNPFGAYNNVLTVAPEGAGGVLRAVSHRTDRDGAWLDVALETTGRSADVTYVALVDNTPGATMRGRAGGVSIALPGAGTHTLRIAADVGGQVTPWLEVPVLDGAPRAGAAGAPFSWHDAVIYQVVVDRFANGDPANDAPIRHDSLFAEANYSGGDLQGLLDRLPYLDSLGVNVLWLSPLYANPDAAHREFPPPHRYYSGYHGYWPTHPREVDEHFGDVALTRRVVDAAHARGMRVLLDFVAAHVHEAHPYARQHPDWFGALELPDGRLNLRLWDEHRLTTWFEPYLPKFDYDAAPAAVEQVTADAIWWLRETGADGFRHDAVKHIPNGFWRALTARLRREAPARELPPYQVGETFGSHALVASYVSPGQLDAQFNFNLYDAAVAALASTTGSLANLAAEVERSLLVYGPLNLMANVMDSHDKPRFLALVEGDLAVEDPAWGLDRPRVDDSRSYRRAALYMSYLMTTPGVPVVYYGDEIGMTGAGDPDNRRPMRWGGHVTPAERELREEVAALIRLRRERPVLRAGAYETLAADADTWAYLRATPGAGVLVVLNKGDAPAVVSIALPPAYGFTRATDALRAGVVGLVAGHVEITVPAGGYRIIDMAR